MSESEKSAPISTEKRLSYKKRIYTINEYLSEPWEWHVQAIRDQNKFIPPVDWDNFAEYQKQLQEINSLMPRPTIEPYCTWVLGKIEGDVVAIVGNVMEWIGKRPTPLTELDIQALVAYIVTADNSKKEDF